MYFVGFMSINNLVPLLSSVRVVLPLFIRVPLLQVHVNRGKSLPPALHYFLVKAVRPVNLD